MALMNYLTGSEASAGIDAVNVMGKDFLQLAVDGIYSIAMWGIAFIQTNFVLILLMTVITIVVGYGISAIRKKRGANVVR